MELILKSDNNSKIAKILALAHKLGISVIQKEETSKKTRPVPPKGKAASANDLLETFGKAPDFPSTEEIRTKTWSSPW